MSSYIMKGRSTPEYYYGPESDDEQCEPENQTEDACYIELYPGTPADDAPTELKTHQTYLRTQKQQEVETMIKDWVDIEAVLKAKQRRTADVMTLPRHGSWSARAVPRRQGFCTHYMTRFWGCIVNIACCGRHEEAPPVPSRRHQRHLHPEIRTSQMQRTSRPPYCDIIASV